MALEEHEDHTSGRQNINNKEEDDVTSNLTTMIIIATYLKMLQE